MCDFLLTFLITSQKKSLEIVLFLKTYSCLKPLTTSNKKVC